MGCRRRTRWWLRREDRSGGPLVIMAVGDITVGGGPCRRLPSDPSRLASRAGRHHRPAAQHRRVRLAPCVSYVDDKAASRIGQAIADLDLVIHDLRVMDDQLDSTWPAAPGPDQ
jgi:hypothetical protein